MADCHMGQEEVLQQMPQTPHHLAPLVHMDKGLTLERSPAAAKKQGSYQDTEQGAQILQTIGQLLLRVDRDLARNHFQLQGPKGDPATPAAARKKGSLT